MNLRINISRVAAVAIAAVVLVASGISPREARAEQPARTILNVSYDPTRELFDAINPAFVEYWRAKSGEKVEVKQSHGGSGKQARAVIDGLEADVVTLALAHDIDALHEKGKGDKGAGLVPADWQKRLPENSTPYSSTIVFVVRKGNPKGIKDWDDLVKTGVSVVSPNPKTSGGARWNYLAAWGYALKHNNNDQDKAKQFLAALFKNVPVLDAGARGSTNTFVQRNIGDVLLGWENDALLVKREFAKEGLEVVYPSISIKAEPPVSVVDTVVDKRGTRDVATAYLEFLYTDKAQEIIAKSFFRASNKAIAEKYADQFKVIPLFTVSEVFGGWKQAHEAHFAEGGSFDQVQAAKSKAK